MTTSAGCPPTGAPHSRLHQVKARYYFLLFSAIFWRPRFFLLRYGISCMSSTFSLIGQCSLVSLAAIGEVSQGQSRRWNFICLLVFFLLFSSLLVLHYFSSGFSPCLLPVSRPSLLHSHGIFMIILASVHRFSP